MQTNDKIKRKTETDVEEMHTNNMQMNKKQSYPKFIYGIQRTEVWGCSKTPQMPNTNDKKNYSKTLHKWQSKLHWKFNMFDL